MNLAEHKLNLFRQIDQMPEELIFEVEQFVSKLSSKKATDSNDTLNLTALESFLKPRIEAAEQGKVVNKSVTQIFAEEQAIHLKPEDMQTFFQALENPPKANDALKEAAKLHEQL